MVPHLPRHLRVAVLGHERGARILGRGERRGEQGLVEALPVVRLARDGAHHVVERVTDGFEAVLGTLHPVDALRQRRRPRLETGEPLHEEVLLVQQRGPP